MNRNQIRSILLSAFAIGVALIAFPARRRIRRLTTVPHHGSSRTIKYLMDRDAEIALARGAAPDAISLDASVLVLTRHGYETAVEGKNGWVCWVGRGWTAVFDHPEFWSPKVRAADCLNPPAARSILPCACKRTNYSWLAIPNKKPSPPSKPP